MHTFCQKNKDCDLHETLPVVSVIYVCSGGRTDKIRKKYACFSLFFFDYFAGFELIIVWTI